MAISSMRLKNFFCVFMMLSQLMMQKVQAAPDAGRDIHQYDGLVKRLSACVSSHGLNYEFPIIKVPPNSNDVFRIVLKADVGLASDGYMYYLLIGKSEDYIFIEQLGGVGGGRVIYGPVSKDFDGSGCVMQK